MREMIEYLVKSLVEHPEEVTVTERQEGEESVLIEVKLSPDDLGKIIGKSGNTINAMRTLLQAAASSHKKHAKLEVNQ